MMTEIKANISQLSVLYSRRTTLIAILSNLPSAPRRHTAGGYCFALPRYRQFAPSGARIRAGTMFGRRLSRSFWQPTGEPIIGVPLLSSMTECQVE
jgi:hypothetical protein